MASKKWLSSYKSYLLGCCYRCSLLNRLQYLRVTINTGPGIQGPKDRGPKDQGPNGQALLHLAFMKTCVNVLSSNVRLYHCCMVTESALLYTQLTLFTPDCAISHYLLAFFILHSSNPRIVSLLHARLQA